MFWPTLFQRNGNVGATWLGNIQRQKKDLSRFFYDDKSINRWGCFFSLGERRVVGSSFFFFFIVNQKRTKLLYFDISYVSIIVHDSYACANKEEFIRRGDDCIELSIQKWRLTRICI